MGKGGMPVHSTNLGLCCRKPHASHLHTFTSSPRKTRKGLTGAYHIGIKEAYLTQWQAKLCTLSPNIYYVMMHSPNPVPLEWAFSTETQNSQTTRPFEKTSIFGRSRMRRRTLPLCYRLAMQSKQFAGMCRVICRGARASKGVIHLAH